MEGLTSYFRGLADATRLRIVNLLLHGELCGCDIQQVLEISQPNISRHLTYLKNTGLVADRRDGFRVFYRVADPRRGKTKRLFEFLRGEFKDQPTLRKDMERLKAAIRAGQCTVGQKYPYADIDEVRSSASARL